MELNDKIQQLEGELKLLKNEMKQVLLDIQEHLLDFTNPFSDTTAALGRVHPAAGLGLHHQGSPWTHIFPRRAWACVAAHYGSSV